MKTKAFLIATLLVAPSAFSANLNKFAENMGTYAHTENISSCAPTVTLSLDQNGPVLQIYGESTAGSSGVHKKIILDYKIKAPLFGPGERWYEYAIHGNKIVLLDLHKQLFFTKNYSDPTDVIDFTSSTQVTLGPSHSACKYIKSK